MDIDLVVGRTEFALDQIAIVLRIEDGLLDVVAGEGPHILERVEQEDRLELRAVAVGAALVTDARGTRVGVVLAELDLAWLGRVLAPLLVAADDVYLLDGDGKLVLRASHGFTSDPVAGQEFAIGELHRCSGTQFDPRVVAALCRTLEEPTEPDTDEQPPSDREPLLSVA